MLTTSQRAAWLAWLLDERHISLDVARQAGLSISETRLTIPVRDHHGEHLFNKYRRAPWLTDGPKYMYDSGASMALFGAETILDAQKIYITEGELDALALRTLGYTAISTTGGAGSFRPEWAELLHSKFVTVIYDADRAGIEGAVRVLQLIHGSSVAWVPLKYGKDITDVIHNGGTEELETALLMRSTYPFPSLDAEPRDRITAWQKVRAQCNGERIAIMQDPKRSPFFVDTLITIAAREEQKAKQEIARATRVHSGASVGKLEKARSFPIASLIKVGANRKALCPFHNDKTPSLHVYQDNHAFCFVCGKRASAIDIYMALHNCDFKTALGALTV